MDILGLIKAFFGVKIGVAELNILKIEVVPRMGEEYERVECSVDYFWSKNRGEIRFKNRIGQRMAAFRMSLPPSFWNERNEWIIGDAYLEGLKKAYRKAGLPSRISDEDLRGHEEFQSLIRGLYNHRLEDLVYRVIFHILKKREVRKLRMIWLGDLDLRVSE